MTGSRQSAEVVRSGRSSAQAITRARFLLKVDEGWTAAQAATALDISERTVIEPGSGMRRRGWRRRCTGATRSTGKDERVEAHLIALACSPAPEGHDHWTLRPGGEDGRLVESLSHETVRLHLKKRAQAVASSGASPR